MEQLSLAKMTSIIQNGLGKTISPKKVVIVGAGLAGLSVALLLKNAGHKVVVLEADSRVGGRVASIRHPFSTGLYYEAGAARFSNKHHLMMQYIKKFQLPIFPYIDATPNDYYFINGIKTRRGYYENNPDILGFNVSSTEKGKTAKDLFSFVVDEISPIITRYQPLTMQDIPAYVDFYSLDTFLQYHSTKLSQAAINKIKVIIGLQGLSHASIFSVIQLLMPWFENDARYYSIVDGNERLAVSLAKELKPNLYLYERVTQIKKVNNEYTVSSKNVKTSICSVVTGDYVVMAIPFSTLRLINIEPISLISPIKWQAIRELNYLPATKIGIEFKYRFWEKQGICGGQSITDLPIRFAQYPSYDIGTDGPAIVTASYTLGGDTLVWDSQSKEDQLSIALYNLAKIHGKVVYQEFVAFHSKTWRQQPTIAGDISIFNPGDLSRIGPAISSPEERLYFAGEHASSYPGWMEGALESGVRTAFQIHRL